jgi:hypothetical protein
MKDEKNIEEAQVTTPEGGGANGIIAFVDENIPELKDATPEEKFAAVLTTLKKDKVFHEKMEELFQSEPMLGALISSVMKDEKSFLEAMAEVISPDEYAAALENEGGDVLKTRDERLGKLKDMEEKDAALSANVEASAGNIEAWLAKKDWDDAKKQDFMERVSAIFNILADGKISDAELEQFANMIYFDDAMSQARNEGISIGYGMCKDNLAAIEQDHRLRLEIAKAVLASQTLRNNMEASRLEYYCETAYYFIKNKASEL